VDGGFNWAYTPSAPIYDIFFVDNLVGYAVGEGTLGLKTVDGGVTWSSFESGTGYSSTVFFIDPVHGWIGSASGGSRTTDGGQTWSAMTMSGCVSVIFTNVDTGYAVLFSGQVLQSFDGGATWENTSIAAVNGAYFNDAALVDGNLVGVGQGGDVYIVQVACPDIAVPATIIELGGMLYTDEATSYQWYQNGVLIPDADTISYTPILSGNYTAVTTDALGCVSEPSAVISVISTSVQLRIPNGDLVMHPNPAQQTIRISRGGEERGRVDVRDARGVLVSCTSQLQPFITLDLSGLPAGLYLVTWVGEQGTRSGRFVKE
jgi:hypothetical protein